jgi:hypothetical protein
MNSTTPLLLSAWSVTTTAREKFQYRNSRPYKDTPRSRWESQQVAFAAKAVRA